MDDTTNTTDTTTDTDDEGAGPSIPLLYSLPVEQVLPGMSTDDGEDVIGAVDTKTSTDWVFYEVYTPRSDDPELEEENRGETVTRWAAPGARVGLAVYDDTKVNGSGFPDAVVVKVPETPPLFYSLPAAQVRPGMSTDDGQDFLTVNPATDPGDWTYGTVYTPRPDDPDRDAANRDAPESRCYEPGERVDLAVFAHTEVDGSRLEDAVVAPART